MVNREGSCDSLVKDTTCAQEFSQNLSIHPTVNGYPAPFRAGEGESDGKRCGSSPQLHCWLFNSRSLMPWVRVFKNPLILLRMKWVSGSPQSLGKEKAVKAAWVVSTRMHYCRHKSAL